MIDPNSTIPHAREARVTMRGVRLTPDGSPVQVSTRSDFIAPEIAPVSTINVELAKGTRDWTDGDAPSVKLTAQLAMAKRRAEVAKHDVERMTCGTAIRKAPAKDNRRVLNVQGPAHRRVF